MIKKLIIGANLSRVFSKRWMEKRGLMQWPASSPDLPENIATA